MDGIAAEAIEQVAATITPPKEPETAARNGTPAKMFRYSTFLHVGEGAERCAVTAWLNTPKAEREGELPTCENIEHFHAWCRLPNQFQRQDIQRKGLAAKARTTRMLKDPDSDVSVLLDNELDTLRDGTFADLIIDELLVQEYGQDWLDAQENVAEREEFEHIAQDTEQFERLRAHEGGLPEAEQSDEFKSLTKQMAAHLNAQREEMEKIQKPRREELKSRSPEALIDLLRAARIEAQGNRVFIDTYNAWMWFVGTFRVEPHPTRKRPYLPMWDEIGQPERPSPGTMFGEAPEVIEALKETYGDLSMSLQAGSAGN